MKFFISPPPPFFFSKKRIKNVDFSGTALFFQISAHCMTLDSDEQSKGFMRMVMMNHNFEFLFEGTGSLHYTFKLNGLLIVAVTF